MSIRHHDMSSPSNSLQYLYGEAEQYFDHANSESQSSMGSPVGDRLPPPPLFRRGADEPLQYDFYVQDFAAGDQYSSPEREAESPEAQPAAAAATKGPAKRKRENRYKNAPPSVLSVCSALSRLYPRVPSTHDPSTSHDSNAVPSPARRYLAQGGPESPHPQFIHRAVPLTRRRASPPSRIHSLPKHALAGGDR